MKCPNCKEIIDDDSWFCDQCGKEIKFCPECHQPKRGTECPACGADLVSAKDMERGARDAGRGTQETKHETAKPQGTAFPSSSPSPKLLEGDGFSLPLKEGVFGRTTGIYPEFSGQIYISRTHGELRCENGQWQIRDLGSHNGTFLNGVKLEVNVWADLHLGDKLKIATTHLTVK